MVSGIEFWLRSDKLFFLRFKGVEIRFQRLIWAGIQLKDEKTFDDYKIPKESSLDLLGRLLSCKRCPDWSDSEHH